MHDEPAGQALAKCVKMACLCAGTCVHTEPGSGLGLAPNILVGYVLSVCWPPNILTETNLPPPPYYAASDVNRQTSTA